MTNKDIEFVISLKKSLSFSVYLYTCLTVLAFFNAYHPIVSEINPVHSICVAIFLFLVTINNYLGETRLHKCSVIIQQLVNSDPGLIKRVNDIQNKFSR